ncbi:MAG: A24 family peptidase [Alphaproteobacteria bacterium]
MLLLIIFLACIFVAVGAGLLASLSDFKGLTIPNSYSVIIIAAFCAAYLSLWFFGRGEVFSPLLSHGLSALFIFVLTAALFATKIMGGGDSKLASAYALWVSLVGLVPFLFYTTLTGGVLGLISLVLLKWKPVKNAQAGSWIARVQAGESKVPYGIAIVIGALASFCNLGYFELETLRSFLGS